jgi:hypothetical protein
LLKKSFREGLEAGGRGQEAGGELKISFSSLFSTKVQGFSGSRRYIFALSFLFLNLKPLIYQRFVFIQQSLVIKM